MKKVWILHLKRQKLYVFFPIFLLFTNLFLVTSSEQFHAQLKVRIISGNEYHTNLNKKNFSLQLDNQHRQISEIIQQTATLSQKYPFLGRNFVLSFQTLSIGKQLQKNINYFFSEILNTYDHLIIITPLKSYVINVSLDKGSMIKDVLKILKRDCQVYNHRFSAAVKDLKLKINLVQGNIYTTAEGNKFHYISDILALNLFLNSFSQDFSLFQNNYLVPDIHEYEKIIDTFIDHDGERWWIQFEDKSKYQIFNEITRVIKLLKSFNLKGEIFRRMLRTKIPQLEQFFANNNFFPSAQLQKTYINGEMRLNIIASQTLSGNKNFPSMVANDVFQIYRQIALHTGGKSIFNHDQKIAMHEIKNHMDHFYQLHFPVSLADLGKKISLSVDVKNSMVSYKDHLHQNDLKYQTSTKGSGKIYITDFTLQRDNISFQVHSIAIHQKKGSGLIKVRVEILDSNKTQLFFSEKVLNCSKKQISILINLPEINQKKVKVKISAADLIANQLTILTKTMTIR